MADERDEIRARVNIVDLVGQSVSLKKTGNTFKGLCPFHQDHNPSFTVSPNTGRYRCWSCGEAGDVFNWVMKTRNVEFVEALQILAELAGVTLRTQDPKERSVRLNQRSAMETALTFFREQLDKSSHAKDYCASRALVPDIQKQWEIGYAPDDRQSLTVTLRKKGFRLADCKALFLVDGDESQGYSDKFHGRLMFPIRDERGDLVAFGGRVLGDGMPKYINSSDTPLYKKSKVLYGMNISKDAMRTGHLAVLVEGYLDVIACHAAGVLSAVASLGTALSQDHAKLLKRWCDSVTVLYDSDAAGQKAAGKASETLLTEGLKVRIAAVPEGKDPDTLLRNAGPAAVKKVAEGGLSPLEYKIHTLETQYSYDEEEFWNLAIKALATAESEMERARFIEELAPKYPKIRDSVAARKALTDRLRRKTITHAAVAAPRVSQFGYMEERIVSSLDSREVTLFRALIEVEYRVELWPVLNETNMFLTKNGAILAQKLLESFPEGAPSGQAQEWVGRIQSRGAVELLTAVEGDSRMHLSREFVLDAVNSLRRKNDFETVQSLKLLEGDHKLAEIQKHLVKHKGGEID